MRVPVLILIPLSLAVFILAGCIDEANSSSGSSSRVSSVATVTSDASADTTTAAAAGTCRPIPPLSALPLAARSVVVSGASASTKKTVFVTDLFGRFKTLCGACHIEIGLGGYQVSEATFASAMDDVWLNSMIIEDTVKIMPPLNDNGKMPEARSSDDPTTTLYNLMKAWMAQGKPSDVFEIDASVVASPTEYLLPKDVASRMTNIGDCIPDKAIVGTELAKMKELDLLFSQVAASKTGTQAERLGLPTRLDQTDLFTLDTETLARHGVIAYAPAYPVWTDGARDLRFVRVPVGQSITFDKATQKFTIPAGTRFYRTVLKSVLDKDGTERWRKMETRLAVAFPDDLTSTTWPVTSVFGTYAWNDDESEAELVTDPLRDGNPFADRVLTYVSDEGAYDRISATTKASQVTAALKAASAIRRYAIPGYRRCGHCHVGSPSEAFVIGFTPLQVKRRPVGEGGVIDWVGDDELGQVDRLVDYGVLTGLSSASDIKGLESSQGSRSPRNDYELKVQGYMLGNCVHCHNPRGDATRQNPELSTVLDMLPSSTGGIFQFSLETMSPRITRGLGGAVSLPYITPSLMDYPTHYEGGGFYTPKTDLDGTNGILAPWRSLLYRGVDTPFTYADDYALFPRMPLHTPGFDCRAPRMFADWMVSIPAVRKSSKFAEYDFKLVTVTGSNIADQYDTNEQPYSEVLPTDSRYASAQSLAQARLKAYHENTPPYANQSGWPSRYNYCPDTSDILDPQVEADSANHPVPTDSTRALTRGTPAVVVMEPDGVPDHPHWVVNDETEIPGDWTPKRQDWADVLARTPAVYPVISETDANKESLKTKQAAEKAAVAQINQVTFTDALRAYSRTPLPMGLWKEKDTCTYAGQRTAGSFTGTERPAWMDAAGAKASARVYMQRPGSLLHDMICSNCHGALADSSGRQAQNLNDMTGGNALVTNLRSGIFGPLTSPGANTKRIFGPLVSGLSPIEDAGPDAGVYGVTGATAEDLSARYFTWMGLGGTQKNIPASILAIVANSQVFGTKRPLTSAPSDANMLSVAQMMCRYVLPIDPTDTTFANYKFALETGVLADGKPDGTPLLTTNGDRALWSKLCGIGNSAILRAIEIPTDFSKFVVVAPTDFYMIDDSYPQIRLGNHRGTVDVGLQADNEFPWCLRMPAAGTTDRDKAESNLATNLAPDKGSWPTCPDSIVPPAGQVDTKHVAMNDLRTWALRGAVNAGFLIYDYLQELAKGNVEAQPSFSACESLPQSTDGGQ